MTSPDTIVALSSGSLPSGVAIIRVSGPECTLIIDTFLNQPISSGKFYLRNIIDPTTTNIIDQALVLSFSRPFSFTGEDIIEFHIHGSVAIVAKLISCLTIIPNVRLAKAGEFTRRAFENGKLDLSTVEATSDLINAETENQRVMAISRLQGNLSKAVDTWRFELLNLLSLLETDMDFSDEGDIDNFNINSFLSSLKIFCDVMELQLKKFETGRLIREGFRVGIGGLPNVGKSSIINMLSGSDVAIVTPEEGTTRDTKEIRLNIKGQFFTFIDSAGIRDSDSIAETQGVLRALEMYETCDLVLWISAPDIPNSTIIPQICAPVIHISNKNDIEASYNTDLSISAKFGQVGNLFDVIKSKIITDTYSPGSILISHQRDKMCIIDCKNAIERAYLSLNSNGFMPELIAEDIRLALFSLERLIGKVDAEEVLGSIFENFCIGK